MSMDNIETDIQSLLQETVSKALDQSTVVTGWVAHVNVLTDAGQRVVTVQPLDQAPALTTGMVAYGKAANDAIVADGAVQFIDEEDD